MFVSTFQLISHIYLQIIFLFIAYLDKEGNKFFVFYLLLLFIDTILLRYFGEFHFLKMPFFTILFVFSNFSKYANLKLSEYLRFVVLEINVRAFFKVERK